MFPHRIILVRRDGWRSPVQPPAQSRSVLFRALFSPLWDISKDGEATASLDLSLITCMGEKALTCIWIAFPMSTLCLLPFDLPLCISERSLLPSSPYPPVRHLQTTVKPSLTLLFSGLSKGLSQPLLVPPVLQPLATLVTLHRACSVLSTSLLYPHRRTWLQMYSR